jgi:hypothetical protein
MNFKENRTCQGCGRFPLCNHQKDCVYSEDVDQNIETEDYWVRRDVQMHLKSKNGEKFNFEIIK